MSTLKVDTISEKTVSGGITFSQDITATLSSSSNIKAPLNATGSAPVYACRAWVNFDGTSGSGIGSSDITIRGSGNVSSITDNGTGDYTVNFTTAMPDANYSVASMTMRNSTYSTSLTPIITALKADTNYANNVSVNNFTITTRFTSNVALQDPLVVTAIIFR